MFSSLTKNNLHHAYLIEGQSNIIVPKLIEYLDSIEIKVSNNPNAFIASYSSLMTEDADIIIAHQNERSFDGGEKIFIISAEFINHQAQNTLLKTFEEPTPSTHFFVIMPSISTLYDTLLSRFSIIKNNQEKIIGDEAKEFLIFSINNRISFIADLIKSHEDDEDSGSIRAHAMVLVSDIEQILYRSISSDMEKLKSLKNVFTDLSNARKYLATAGASVKMILEQLALVLPVMK